jgi:pimeloyl-ACP methyl ester carboxylesterase
VQVETVPARSAAQALADAAEPVGADLVVLGSRRPSDVGGLLPAVPRAPVPAAGGDSFVDRGWFAPAPVGLRDWLRRPRPRAAWGRRVARRLDYRGRLTEVRAPALVVAGGFDPQMPPACAVELANGLPDARLAVLWRSGHYPFIEEPAAFWSLVQGFLASAGRDGRRDDGR